MKKFVLFFVALMGVEAQQRPTIYQTLAANFGQNNMLVGPVTNIGQVGHRFTFNFKNNGVNTCDALRTTPGVAFSPAFYVVQSPSPAGSINDTIKLPYFVENATVNFLSGIKFSKTIITNALAPFVYVYLDNINWTKCLVDITYGGSVSPINYSTPPLRDGAFIAGEPNSNITVTSCAIPNTGVDTFCFGDAVGNGITRMRIYRLEIRGGAAGVLTTSGRLGMVIKYNDGVTNANGAVYDWGPNVTVFESGNPELDSLYLSGAGDRIYFNQSSAVPQIIVTAYYRGE